LSLSDFRRTIIVEGSRPDQVEALFALLKNELGKHAILLSGHELRFILLLLLMLMTAVVPVSYTPDFPLPINLYMKVLLTVVVVSIWLSMLWVPYHEWLSGFTIYSGSASFASRYSAELTLLGVVLTVLIPLAQSVIHRYRQPQPTTSKSKRTPKKQSISK
jgi:hypothetical protein